MKNNDLTKSQDITSHTPRTLMKKNKKKDLNFDIHSF